MTIFFYNIENNLRELGFGDVTVNKKMKELNKVLWKEFLLNLHKIIMNTLTRRVCHFWKWNIRIRIKDKLKK